MEQNEAKRFNRKREDSTVFFENSKKKLQIGEGEE